MHEQVLGQVHDLDCTVRVVPNRAVSPQAMPPAFAIGLKTSLRVPAEHTGKAVDGKL